LNGEVALSVRAKITSAGLLSRPAEMRERYGLEEGVDVVIDDTGDGLMIRTLSQAIARAQAMSRRITEGKPGASVDDFIASRRAEAARE
jgi:bifunctional DNA-binding transcriptional regulator/antitoxin component of YhaV-PrlF toxin-antitoxin module